MSKADEIFEKLGYEKDKEMAEMYCKVIIPFKKQKDIQFDVVTEEHIEIRMSKYDEFGELKFDRIVLSLKELQAINEKVEELRMEFIKNKCLCERDYEEIDDYYILSINDVKKTLQIIQNKDGYFGMLLGEIPIKHCPECGKRIGCD